MKISSYTIGNRTRDLPACSAVSHSTAPPRAPYFGSELPNLFLDSFTVEDGTYRLSHNVG
jgi:hypothetical protein